MQVTINAVCPSCGCYGEVGLPDTGMSAGMLACPACGGVLACIDVSAFAPWVEGVIAAKDAMHRSGQLGTRKQSAGQSDVDIDRDGLGAELASCLLICQASLAAWQQATERGGNNRGRDLPPELTGLDRPVEVKQTRYKTATTGYLLVRPPRWTPGPMRAEYIEDSIYVLMFGRPWAYQMLGWTDRDGLVRHGVLNPVPVGAGQRQCWGIHWRQLRPLAELADRFTSALASRRTNKTARLASEAKPGRKDR